MGLWRRLKANSKSSTRNSLASDQIGWETMESSPQLERPNVYAKTPLNDPGDIRLLELLPGEDDPISCRLKVVSLGSRPLYTGISYTWGDDTSSHDIQVNDFPFRVRSNLLCLLQDIRHGNHVRTVWIDAVCINQNDMAEKNSQVARMAEIYKTAVSVTAWLDLSVYGYGHILETWLAISNEPRTTSPPVSKQKRRVALDALFNHPYWNRRWIIQEIAVAQFVVLSCGNSTMPLAQIKALARESDQKFGTKRQDSLAVRLCNLQGNELRPEKTTLSKLLYDYSATECEEPVDKVYALVSLSQSASRDFQISYDIDRLDLLQRTVNYAADVEKLSANSTVSFALELTSQLRIDRADFFQGPKVDHRQDLCAHSYLYARGKVISTTIDAKHYLHVHSHREDMRALLHCVGSISLVRVESFLPRESPAQRTNSISVRFRRGEQSTDWDPFGCQEVSPMDMFPFGWQDEHLNTDVDSLLFGFATARLLPGDIVCQFTNTAMAIVLREDPSQPSFPGTEYEIVARARLGQSDLDKSVRDADPIVSSTEELAARISWDIETHGCEILDLVMLASGDF